MARSAMRVLTRVGRDEIFLEVGRTNLRLSLLKRRLTAAPFIREGLRKREVGTPRSSAFLIKAEQWWLSQLGHFRSKQKRKTISRSNDEDDFSKSESRSQRRFQTSSRLSWNVKSRLCYTLILKKTMTFFDSWLLVKFSQSTRMKELWKSNSHFLKVSRHQRKKSDLDTQLDAPFHSKRICNSLAFSIYMTQSTANPILS